MDKIITAADKPFGIRGELIPAEAFRDIKEDITYKDNIIVSVHDKVLEVGYDKEIDKERAQNIVQDFVTSWSFRNGAKIEVNLNMSWKPDINGNRAIGIEMHESVKACARIMTTATKKGMSYVVKQHSDSYSFINDISLVKKAENDHVLSLILRYFYEEVLDAEKPKVGIYRIVEELDKKMGGREKLASLVGEDKKYINDIMESVQEHRHSRAWLDYRKVRVILSDQEGINRARKLIQAYAKCIREVEI